MKILILSLVALFFVALIAGLLRNSWYRRKIKRGEIDSMPEIQPAPADGCCGQHETCEKESLLAAVSKKVEYYEDEELDAYRGTPSDAYTDDITDQFREVLYTMRSTEVAGWVRSLQLRGIELPDGIKDEVIMIVGELRESGEAHKL